MKIKIPLVRPTIENDDIRSMISAASKKEISYGKLTHKFEEKFACYLGLKGGVATNSGTSALHLALRALNIKNYDEVILPAYTCISLLHSIHYVHAIPIFVDINYNVKHMNYNMDIEKMLKKITKNTKAIIFPHLFGSPAEINKVANLDIPLIEDATQCIGSVYKNRLIGSYGNISVFSFHESKMLACGEGGMILTNSKDLLDKIKYLADYAYEQPDLRLKRDKTYLYKERYNYKMNGINAMLGLSQLKRIEVFVKKRKEIAKMYTDEFSHLNGIELPDPLYKPNIFFRYIVSLKEKHPIDILNILLKKGIEGGRGVCPPLHYYEQNQSNNKNYPTTEYALNHLISIPLYPSLTESEIVYIIKCFKDALR
jgi:dTDP-4-amino-4,6-dideoxygalactose transaminase